MNTLPGSYMIYIQNILEYVGKGFLLYSNFVL